MKRNIKYWNCQVKRIFSFFIKNRRKIKSRKIHTNIWTLSDEHNENVWSTVGYLFQNIFSPGCSFSVIFGMNVKILGNLNPNKYVRYTHQIECANQCIRNIKVVETKTKQKKNNLKIAFNDLANMNNCFLFGSLFVLFLLIIFHFPYVSFVIERKIIQFILPSFQFQSSSSSSSSSNSTGK